MLLSGFLFGQALLFCSFFGSLFLFGNALALHLFALLLFDPFRDEGIFSGMEVLLRRLLFVLDGRSHHLFVLNDDSLSLL